MAMPLTVLPAAASPDRSSVVHGDFIRRRALVRLYERKAAVEDLIRSLERYERTVRSNPGECIVFRGPVVQARDV